MANKTQKSMWLVVFADLGNKLNEGIRQKLLAQKKAWEKLGFKVEGLTMYGNNITDADGHILAPIHSMFLRKSFFKYLIFKLKTQKEGIDLVYIRYPFSTPLFYSFLNQLKKVFPQVKTIIEIPTYPYKQEFSGLKFWKYYLDQVFQKWVFRKIDLLVVIGNEWNQPSVKTLSISNGIDVKPTIVQERGSADVIKMVAVGHWQKWHGLDRVIDGLAEYEQQKPDIKVHLNIVGHGPVMGELKRMTEKHHLQNYVLFSGEKDDLETEKICLDSHVGIGVLGAHRKGLENQSPLKHRLYVSLGLPVVFSTKDTDLSGELPFVWLTEENDESIDISELVNFVQTMTISPTEIQQFAQQHLGWESRMEKVLHHITLAHETTNKPEQS